MDLSNAIPFSRISAAVSGRAVTCVTSSRSMTSMRTLCGAPSANTSPLLTRRMFSSVWTPGTVSGGIENGEFGRTTSSRGAANVGPTSVARTSASGGNGGNPSGAVVVCR